MREIHVLGDMNLNFLDFYNETSAASAHILALASPPGQNITGHKGAKNMKKKTLKPHQF